MLYLFSRDSKTSTIRKKELSKMATKFKSPRRWDDYQMNKALCFVVLAVITCVILLGFASASLTSYFTQVSINRKGYVSAYSYTDRVGDLYPSVDIDGVFIDPYHYNTVSFFKFGFLFTLIYLRFFSLHFYNIIYKIQQNSMTRNM